MSSLMAANLFIFSQGWYLLHLTGEKVSVGLSWSLFFLPGLVFMPVIGKLLSGIYLKRLLLIFELTRIVLFLGLILCLSFYSSSVVIYVFIVLFGIALTPYYPTIYALLKKTSPSEKTTSYSHWFEAGFQLATMLSVIMAGIIYEKFGFMTVLYMALVLFAVAVVFWALLIVNRDESSSDPFSFFQCYVDFGRLFHNVFRQNGRAHSSQIQGTLRFGCIHLIPSAIILTSNIPILLYVHEVMKKGPIEYSILDGVYSSGAFVAGLIWGKYSHLSKGLRTFVLVSLFSSLMLLLFGHYSGEGLVPYGLIFIAATFLGSSKSMSRAKVLEDLPEALVAQASSLFQFCGALQTVALAFVITHFSVHVSVASLFTILAGVMVIYSFVAILFLQGRKI